MAMAEVAAAIGRMRKALERRPRLGKSPDSPAVSRWERDLRFVTSHPGGARFATDMPASVGGGGGEVTPGWLFRAGLAACSATSIAMVAAAEGVELSALELTAGSVSDGRAMLGMPDVDGAPVSGCFDALQLHVRIAARGAPEGRLRALVDEGLRRSPVYATLAHSARLAVTVDVAGA